MKRRLFFGLVVTMVLALTLVGPVLAQDEGEEPTDPIEEPVPTVIDGVIVDVDLETGEITLADGTVIILGGEYEHPIVDLLDTYFGDGGPDLDALAEALGALEMGDDTVVGVVFDETDGVWKACLNEDCSEFVEVSEEDATVLQEALDSLNVSLDVISDGETNTTTSVGDDIAAYHDSGLGFGELVKLYAIVAECEENAEEACDLTVDFLVGEYLGGMGMGELFELYGKPSLLGVGHVRQLLRDQGIWPPDDGGDLGGDDGGDGDDGDGTDGICNARSHGGNANASGHGDVVCP